MPYTKTIWAEDTPITTALLNKIENGIESAAKDALPLTGGTLTGSITLPNSTKGQIKQTLSNGTITPTLYITSNDNLRVGSADISNVCLYCKTNPKTSVDGSTYTLYHTGNKPTPGDIGALPSTGGTLTGNLAFSNYGGSELNASIHSLALHAATGNGQIMTVGNHNVIYIGNTNTPLVIESNRTPDINVGGTTYQLYHTGNKPTAWDIGAMSSNGPSFSGNMIQAGAGGRDWIYHINADAGSLHIAPHNNGTNDWDRQITFDRDGQIFCNGRKKVPTWDGNPTHYMFRYGSGLGGANGYITFSY